MAKLSIPPNNGSHTHATSTPRRFQWTNANPTVTGATYWRLKVGSAKFGYNFYIGTAPFSQTYIDPVTLINMSTFPKGCYATVEWSFNGTGGPWTHAQDWTTFTCN
jgi:hypothetical protein